jgi:osmotically-inducible protein OsmY
MQKLWNLWLVVILMAFGTVPVVASANAVEDAAITARIETMFALNGHLSPFEIKTSTTDGVVTLAGSVDNQVQKDLAAELSQSVSGVTGVKNEILIMQDVPATPTKRTWQQKVDDATVSASVRTRILYNREFSAFNIKVKTENGAVTLSGVVNNQAQSDRIAKIASETKGVELVNNNLTVHEKERLDPVETTARQVSDEWIEKRVESGLLLNRHLSIRKISTEVESGTCILGGSVDSEDEKKLAELIARNTNGVVDVQNNLKVRVEPTEILEPLSPSE